MLQDLNMATPKINKPRQDEIDRAEFPNKKDQTFFFSNSQYANDSMTPLFFVYTVKSIIINI